MKKFLSLCMALVLTFCAIPAMNVSASVVSTVNPTDGYTQDVKTVSTNGAFTICESQVAETATVSGSSITGSAIVTDTPNIVIESSNDNVKVDKVTSVMLDSNGYATGNYITYLTFTGIKASTTKTTITVFKNSIVSGNEAKIVAIDTGKLAADKFKAATFTTASLNAALSASNKATYEITVRGHNEVKVPKLDPTTSAVGYTEYSYCSVCDKVLTPSTIIAKTECTHTGAVKQSETQSTCSVNGVITYYCPIEKTTFTEKKPLIAHTKGADVKHHDATCTEKGYDEYTCTVCGAKVIDYTDPILKHHYVKVVTCEPTFEEDGTALYVCDHEGCNEFKPFEVTVKKLKAGSISSLKAGKKAITVNIKKSANVKKYQIRYSTKSNMSGAKKITVTGSKKITGLKANTKYYVQIRSINGDNVSSWSAKKTVKTSK